MNTGQSVSAVRHRCRVAFRDRQPGLSQSLERRDQARAIRLDLPVRAAVRAVPPASLTVLDGVPGVDYADGTVSFTADSFEEVQRRIGALVGVAETNYYRRFRELTRGVPGKEAQWFEYNDAVFRRWLDYESERWPPLGGGR